MRRPVPPFLLVPALAAGLLLGSGRPSAAQQPSAPRDTVWWYVSSYQIEWPKMDSLVKLVRAYTLPTVAEAKKMGTLLDYRVLVHAYGSEYNYQIIRQYRRFEDIAHDTTVGAAARRLVPDPARMKEIQAAFNWVFGGGGHRDEIYREVRP